MYDWRRGFQVYIIWLLLIYRNKNTIKWASKMIRKIFGKSPAGPGSAATRRRCCGFNGIRNSNWYFTMLVYTIDRVESRPKKNLLTERMFKTLIIAAIVCISGAKLTPDRVIKTGFAMHSTFFSSGCWNATVAESMTLPLGSCIENIQSNNKIHR